MEDPIYLPPLNQDAALALNTEIEVLLNQINTHELRLARSYARLGGLLKEVKAQQFWISYGYKKFSSYLEFIREKIGRERSQLYAILSVAETLLPLVSEDQLEEVGITKAHELKRLVKEGGSLDAVFYEEIDPKLLPTPGFDQIDGAINLTAVRIMDYAARPKVTAAQLRVKVNEILHVKEGPKGLWVDLGGFYAETDERKEIEQFWELGKKLLVPEDEQSEHVWKKTVFMDAIREAVSTWAPEAGNG